MNLLTPKEDSLQELDREIEQGVDDECLEKKIRCAESYIKGISIAKSKIKGMLRYRMHETTSTSRTSTNTSPAELVQRPASVVRGASPAVKLPKLETSKSGGELRSWQGFWSGSTINANPTLSSVDTFKYLTIYLTRKAAVAVARLDVTADDYEIALDIPKERFGRKKIIIDGHMSRPLTIQPLRDSRSMDKLRALIDNIYKLE